MPWADSPIVTLLMRLLPMPTVPRRPPVPNGTTLKKLSSSTCHFSACTNFSRSALYSAYFGSVSHFCRFAWAAGESLSIYVEYASLKGEEKYLLRGKAHEEDMAVS